MSVIPGIGRYIGGDIPATSAVVGDKNFTANYPAQCRGETAGGNVLLMTVNDIGAPNFFDNVPGQRIHLLFANVVWLTGDANLQSAQNFFARILAKAQ
jgi:hypothetical protein